MVSLPSPDWNTGGSRTRCGCIGTEEPGIALAMHVADPRDAERIQALIRGLSMHSRYQRFFVPLHELPPPLLAQFTSADPVATVTLLVETPDHAGTKLIAMAQYVAAPFPERCEIAVVVADGWQRRGIGSRLLRTLKQLACAAGVTRIEADILADNGAMLKLARRLGYSLTRLGGGIVHASLAVEAPCPE